MIEILNILCAEADYIKSKHDGIHNIHGFNSAIHNTRSNYIKNPDRIPTYDVKSNLDYLIRNMRIADKLGYWPKKHEKVEHRTITNWEDIGA